MTAWPVVFAAVAGGLVGVERKAFLQAQLARPIVLGPLLGWILGDAVGGLVVAAPLELLWIGAANLGASLPQHETAAASSIIAAAVSAGTQGTGVDGTLACFAFVLFAPMALVARRLERLSERANEKAEFRAEVWLRRGRPARAVRQHLTALWRPFVGIGLLVAVAAAVGGPLLAAAREEVPRTVRLGLAFGWALFWAVGGAAAVRAARLPNGAWLAAIAAVISLFIGLLVQGGAW